jgi:hypothetical protein
MTAGLQKQGIGDDGADGGYGEQARDRVLRAMQKNPHQQAAFFLDRNGPGAAASARHVIVQ